MKLTSIRKVVHEIAQRNMPLAATILEVKDQLERRHNLGRGMFDIVAMTGKTWKQLFEEMPDFCYNDEKQAFYVEDCETYDKKCQARKKKMNKKKSSHKMLEYEFSNALSITEEELEKRKKAAFEREKEERRKEKEAYRAHIGKTDIPTIILEEEEDVEEGN